MVLPEVDKESSLIAADRIRSAVANKIFKVYDETLRLTICLGIAIYPISASNPKQLIERADEAMYEAKAKGKNCTFFA